MKKNLFLIFVIALVCVSCNDWLELSPTDKLAAGNMWTSEDLADKGIAGLYSVFYPSAKYLTSPQLSRQVDGINRQGIEALGFPTAYYSNNYPVRLLTLEAKRAGDFQLSQEWKFGYTIIHSANDAIANLHKAGLSEEKFERYQCEARFFRAWAYNRLNMLYQGVPIYLEPTNNEDMTKTQSTAEEVWKVCLDDLKYCIDNPNLPDNTLTVNYGHPSKGAAYALRGMIHMWQKDYEAALGDFEKVEQCGYGLWEGEYIDLFKYENDHHKEMIFTIQFDETTGYSDNIQMMVGARDTYNSWTEWKPSPDFVDYYRKADGSVFVWSEVPGLEDWDLLTPAQREVFFCRDELKTNPVLKDLAAEVRNRIGEKVFDDYYLDSGNEDRIRQAYEGRDPRLQQSVVTPYKPVNCFPYLPSVYAVGKQARWPLLGQANPDGSYDGADFWLDKRSSAFYCYRKYVEFEEGRLSNQSRSCQTDWPLIRYTQILLQRAEALARLDRIGEAVDLVNRIRTRAHMPPLVNGGAGANGVTGQEDMLDRIRYESRVELCVESVNFFEEVRWGTWKESKFQGQMTNGGKSWWGDIKEETWYWSDTLWPWSAPLGEIQRNPAIQKREGWTY